MRYHSSSAPRRRGKPRLFGIFFSWLWRRVRFRNRVCHQRSELHHNNRTSPPADGRTAWIVTLGVTPRSKPGYTACSCYAFESRHFAFADLLDRGTGLSPPLSFRSAVSCARQSLWQRLISPSPLCKV